MGTLWRLYRGIATLLFTAELLLMLWLVIGAGLASPPSLSSILGGGPTPTPTATPDPRAGEQLLDRARATATAAASGARFVVEVTDAEINSLLAQQTSTAAVKDVTVQFLAGKLSVRAGIVEPVPLSAQAEGTLVAQNGDLSLTLDSGSAGALPLPRAVLDLLEGQANQALAEALARQNVYVEGVELLPGRARLTVRSR